MDQHVVIVGSMAAGKTSVGRALATRLGRPYRDSDADIEAREGVTGREVAARDGVPRLHELEAEALAGALDAEVPSVIGAAASVLDRPELVDRLGRDAHVVWLDPPVEVLAQRLATGGHRRPLADALADLRTLRARRLPAFERVADLTLADPEATPDELAATIERALADGTLARRAR